MLLGLKFGKIDKNARKFGGIYEPAREPARHASLGPL